MNLVTSDSLECTVTDVNGTTKMTTTVEDPKDAPASRDKKDVKSVFPKLFSIDISSLGDSFEGAYKDKNDRVYAIRGDAIVDIDDDDDDSSSTSTAQSLLSALASRTQTPPAENIFAFMDHSGTQNSGRRSAVQNKDASSSGSVTKLKITAILNNSCMASSSKDPSRYVDTVAQAALQDFHDIMVYYMDEDLRKLFISASPPTLSSEVKSIAESDRAKNSTFYKKLQAPYPTSMLANCTLDPHGGDTSQIQNKTNYRHV